VQRLRSTQELQISGYELPERTGNVAGGSIHEYFEWYETKAGAR